MIRRLIVGTYRTARRLVIGVVGGTILLVGIILVFLPGPAILVIPIGLGILSLEFAWAKRLLSRFHKRAGSKKNKDSITREDRSLKE